MSRPFRRSLAACALALTSLTLSRDVLAQQYLIGADAGLSSGIEGGGQPPQMRLTRTRLRLGGDLRIDESPDDIFEFGVLAELEPAAFGADLRYARMAG